VTTWSQVFSEIRLFFSGLFPARFRPQKALDEPRAVAEPFTSIDKRFTLPRPTVIIDGERWEDWTWNGFAAPPVTDQEVRTRVLTGEGGKRLLGEFGRYCNTFGAVVSGRDIVPWVIAAVHFNTFDVGFRRTVPIGEGAAFFAKHLGQLGRIELVGPFGVAGRISRQFWAFAPNITIGRLALPQAAPRRRVQSLDGVIRRREPGGSPP
jgi:hypothetical protein